MILSVKVAVARGKERFIHYAPGGVRLVREAIEPIGPRVMSATLPPLLHTLEVEVPDESELARAVLELLKPLNFYPDGDRGDFDAIYELQG